MSDGRLKDEGDLYDEFQRIAKETEISERWHHWAGVRVGFALAEVGGRIMLAILNEVHEVVVETRRTRETLEDMRDTLKQMQVFRK